MKLDENLTNDNFDEYALCSYTNLRCHGKQEFFDDLLHIKYLKRLFRKYLELGTMEDTRIRLAINHLIIFYNVFQITAATKMLFFRLEPSLYPILKTFLVHLHFLPAIVHNVDGLNILTNHIEIDNTILQKLRSI